MLRNHYIKKNGLFLKRETVMYESDYLNRTGFVGESIF